VIRVDRNYHTLVTRFSILLPFYFVNQKICKIYNRYQYRYQVTDILYNELRCTFVIKDKESRFRYSLPFYNWVAIG